jgi:hypothetical protein
MCAKKKTASKAAQNTRKSTTAASRSKAKPRAARNAKKLTALAAAARVLSEAGRPMTTRELIEVMAGKALWTSPNGQTPAATLFSALMREIKIKGKESRFAKSERGKFAVKA